MQRIMKVARSLFKVLIGKTLTRLMKEVLHWFLRVPERCAYLFSDKIKSAYTETENFISDVKNYHIDQGSHQRAADRAINNFKIQRAEKVSDIYRPGEMWDNVFKQKQSLREWEQTGDDSLLKDRLLGFYRNDLNYGFRDSFLYGLVEDSSQNLKRNVYKTIKTYDELVADDLTFDPKAIGVTDAGQNFYVIYGDKKLTLQFNRHAYYLNQMNKLGVLSDSMIFGELGSGGGGFVITAKRAFPKATFVCFDLPTTLLVTSYNVIMNFPGSKIGFYEDFKDKNKISTEDLRAYDFVILPTWCIEKVDSNTFDAFYNADSLCAMAMETIQNYLDVIERLSKKYFFTINRNVSVFHKILGVNMITLDNFPFSSNARIIHAQEDRGMDFFHQALRSRCHYKEVLIEYDK